jgi:hypothetical protein
VGLGIKKNKQIARINRLGCSLLLFSMSLKLDDALSRLLSGRTVCRERELVPLLLAGGAATVTSTAQVLVQTLSGATFTVRLETDEDDDSSNQTVSKLKESIQKITGTPVDRQDLFVVRAVGEATVQSSLKISDVISEDCTVALCVSAQAQWNWVLSEAQLPCQFSLKGVAAALKQHHAGFDNCLLTKPPMEHGSRHTISVKLLAPASNTNSNFNLITFVGLAKIGTQTDEAVYSTDSVWYLGECGLLVLRVLVF